MIIGIDEVGRGCWAGPLLASAVGFDDTVQIDGLTDSKKLTARMRRQLVEAIKLATPHIGIGWVWPREINQLGLTQSVQLAMQRALDQLEYANHQIIIDGNYNYLPHIPNTEAVVKADGTVPTVSAASIIAKVARDFYMAEIAKKYPGYGFDSHVGYGTAKHIQALELYGVLPIHRTNYKPIKKYVIAQT
jgi:ribonuclease HII